MFSKKVLLPLALCVLGAYGLKLEESKDQQTVVTTTTPTTSASASSSSSSTSAKKNEEKKRAQSEETVLVSHTIYDSYDDCLLWNEDHEECLEYISSIKDDVYWVVEEWVFYDDGQ